MSKPGEKGDIGYPGPPVGWLSCCYSDADHVTGCLCTCRDHLGCQVLWVGGERKEQRCVCARVCARVCVHACVCMCVCMCVCASICVCMYVCMYICELLLTWCTCCRVDQVCKVSRVYEGKLALLVGLGRKDVEDYQDLLVCR